MAGERRSATELIFLARVPLALRAIVIIIVAVAVGVAGDALYRLQVSLAAQRAAGASLNALQSALATGSGPRTLWIGWAAALFFAWGVFRVRRGPAEPSAGRKSVEMLSAAEMRSGLRREYVYVRLFFVIVLLIAAVDVARTFALLAGAQRQTSIVWAALEAAGLVVAALTLGLWVWWFGADIRRLGAL